MVPEATGQVADTIPLENRASKGKTGGRTMPMHPDVHAALVTLQTWRRDVAGPDRPVFFSKRGGGLSPATVRLWFHRLYTSLKIEGCSSHAGCRTFMTRAARKVAQVGGACATCRHLPGIPAWRCPNAIPRGTRQPSGSWWRCCACLVPRCPDIELHLCVLVTGVQALGHPRRARQRGAVCRTCHRTGHSTTDTEARWAAASPRRGTSVLPAPRRPA